MIDEATIKTWEDFAFYESGLASHGCLEKFDQFQLDSIERYGRMLLKQFSEHVTEQWKTN